MGGASEIVTTATACIGVPTQHTTSLAARSKIENTICDQLTLLVIFSPTGASTVEVMANQSDLAADRERIRLESVPDDAMQYMCPVCLAEGSKPMSIIHSADCPYLKRRDDR
jgi:hypothetical protein